MLKTTENTGSAANLKETKDGVGGDSMVGKVVCSSKATNLTKKKNLMKTTKSKIFVKSKNHDFPKSKPEKAGNDFLTSEAKLAFTQLKQAFVKAPILYYFDLKSHLQIKTDASSYTIGNILS